MDIQHTKPNNHMIEWIENIIKVSLDNKYSYHESLRCNDVFPDPKFSLSSGGILLHNCLNDAGGHQYRDVIDNFLSISIRDHSIEQLLIVLSDSCIVNVVANGIEHNHKSITHNHLKIICTSLNTYSPINDKIKQIIYDEVQAMCPQYIYDQRYDLIMEFYYIDDLYRNIVQAILTNKLTDFTLILANDNSKQFKCCKALLQTIPYFDMIFKDTEIVDNFIIIPDECIVKLIKSLFKEGILCTAIEYVEIFELMDKYLMKDYFDSMIQIGYGYGDFIINELIKQNRFDKIRTLNRILQDNIKSEMDTNTIKLLIQKIVRSDMGKFFTTFDDWQNLFEDPYKLKYIYNSGKLELLNIAEIKPELVLKFLSLHNFANIEKYSDMINVIENNHFSIFDPNNCGFTGGTGSYSKVFIVHSYFPIINYTKYSELPVSIMERTDKYIFIRFNKNVPFKIKIGSIIASDKTITPESPHLGCVTKITAYSDKTKMKANVNEATYIAPSLGLINYKLFITEKEHSKKENKKNHFSFDIKGCMRIWLVEYV